jgi:hypothetical protein
MPKRISNAPSDINRAAHLMVERSTELSEPQPPAKKPHRSTKTEISRVMSAMGRKGGKIGGKASLVTMTPEERSARALQAAKARWDKPKSERKATD